MILEFILVIVAFAVLFLLCARYVDSVFNSGMTAEQIEELGEKLEKLGYGRREDVDGFALFELKKSARRREE